MNAPHLHLIVNHSPLFAELAALLLLAAGAALRKRDLVAAALIAAILAAPLAVAAFFSGRATAEVIGRTEGVDQEAIGPHEESAEVFAVVTALTPSPPAPRCAGLGQRPLPLSASSPPSPPAYGPRNGAVSFIIARSAPLASVLSCSRKNSPGQSGESWNRVSKSDSCA